MPTELLAILGDRIRRWRKRPAGHRMGWPEKSGIDRGFLADVERGRRNISILNLALIAKGLDMSLVRLLSKF